MHVRVFIRVGVSNVFVGGYEFVTLCVGSVLR